MSRRALYAALALPLFATPARASEEASGPSYREQIAATVDGAVKAREQEGVRQPDNAIALRTGAMSFRQGGFAGKKNDADAEISLDSGLNLTNGALEFSWFARRSLSTFLGYRIAYHPDIKRVQYQAGYGGVRYYPLTVGAPAVAFRDLTLVRQDGKIKPFVEGGASLGRYLARVFGEEAALDVSSEFYGVQAGLGAGVPIGGRWTLDLSCVLEQARGYGPLQFEATTLFAYFGLGAHY